MAKNFIRRFTKRTFLFITIILCLIYLLALLIPFLNPQRWWLLSFLSLTVPYLFFILFFTAIFWLIAKPRLALLPVASLLIGYKEAASTFALNFSNNSNAQSPEASGANNIRIITWNVANMYGLSNNTNIKNHDRTELAAAIMEQHPDVFCLQEFNHSYTQGEQANNIGLFTKNYPHYFYAEDFNKENGYYTSGSIIFSKYPIIHTEKIKYPGTFAESLIAADIVKGNDTIRIYTTHLQSFGFNQNDYAAMEKIKEQDEQAVQASKNLISKMKIAFTTRAVQADIVKKEIATSPYPSIVCGDFNDVPTSYTYYTIRGERQDAFLKQGLGVGKTYIQISPTLRIDYVLPDNNFSITNFDMLDENLSDHFMLITDLKK